MSGTIERTGRLVAAAVVASFALVAAVLGGRSGLLATAVVLGVAAVVGALAATRLQGWPLAGGSLVALGGFTVLAGGGAGNVGWFGVCVLAGWCSFFAATVPAAFFGAVAVLGFVVQLVADRADSGWTAWIAGTVFTSVACLLAAQQRVLLEQLRAAQAGLADRARAEERTRVAREMHDVIGHALTVTLLHLSSARLALDDEPAVARASLEEAERHARRSLEEVRASVGLLREGPAATAPLPGGADLDGLVETFRVAGTTVSWQVDGEPAGLPAATGLAAYRIVQEALTNAARHAPGATTAVRVRVGDGQAQVVVDTAEVPADRPVGAGSGLLGMRERAEAVGGRVEAGPAGRGWRVEAVLPT